MQPLRTAPLTRWRWVFSCAAAELIGLGSAAAIAVGLQRAFGEPTSLAGKLAVWLTLGGAGAVEGAALGSLQWRALRRRVPTLPASAWVGVTVGVAVTGWLVGMAGPVLGGASEPSAPPTTEPSLAFIAGSSAAMGAGAGLLFGAAQWLVLRRHVERAGRWVWIHAPAWAAALSLIFIGATLPDDGWSAWSTLLSGGLGGLAGGAALGLLTSGVATRLSPWVSPDWTLAGKCCAVTGANAGLGRAIALGLAQRGARVVLLCRSRERGEETAAWLRAQVHGAEVEAIELDLSSATSVRRGGAMLAARCPALDVLVHDAGATFRAKTPTELGVEATLAVDAAGPWLLTQLLLPALRARGGRVLTLTGIYQRKGEVQLDDLSFERRPYDWLAANNQAQAARLAFTAELARLEPTLFCAAIHPGAVLTRAQAQLPAAVRALIATVLRPGFVRADVGALTVLRHAAAPAPVGPSGRFWDRFTLTADAPRPGVAEGLWRRFEELLGPP